MNEFINGDMVRVIDGDNEIFVISQLDDTGKCWIGDDYGFGWYIHTSKLILVENEEDY